MVGNAHGLSTPIAALPDDVLRLIFRIVYQSRSSSASIRSLSVSTTVSHVCHKWRRVAVDYAVLWSTVYWDDRRFSKSTFAVLELLLQRSKKALISIIIRSYTLSQFERLDRFVDSILPHMWRCRELHIAAYPTDLMFLLRTLSNSPGAQPKYLEAPKLESFSARPTEYYIGSDWIMDLADIGTLFGGASPTLREVKLTSIRELHFLESNLLTVQTLHIDEPTPHIHRCNSLKKLVYEGYESPKLPFDLPTLRHLVWSQHSAPDNALGLLSCRCWANLTDIDLDLPDVSTHLTILSHTTNLISASIRATDQGGSSAEVIVATLPRLETLHLYIARPDHFDMPPAKGPGFLDCLCVPRLQHLSMRSGLRSSFENLNPLWRLIERCRPPLISLSLMYLVAGDATFYTAIESLPDLRLLELASPLSEFGREVLVSVMEAKGGRLVLKNLTDMVAELEEGGSEGESDCSEQGSVLDGGCLNTEGYDDGGLVNLPLSQP